MNRFSVSLLVIVGVSISGCQKLRDYYNFNGNVEVPNCRVVAVIDKNNYPDESYLERTHTVTYNDAGFPEVVTEIYLFIQGPQQSLYDNPNVHLYDNQNRLIQEGPGALVAPNPSLRRYVYEENASMPVRDTLYILQDIYVEEFEFDQQGRITRVQRRLISSADENTPSLPDQDLGYFYDLRGNRQEKSSNPGYNGPIQYSDKPSLYSLHRVWQLKYRDFSRNATATAKTLNEEGLPLTFADSPKVYFQPFLSADPGATVQYDCE